MPSHNRRVAHLSRETGISGPTLYTRKKLFQTRGFVVPVKPSAPDRRDARAKLAAVIQTASMNEVERSAYCREHGLSSEQLNTWKTAFKAMDATDTPADKAQLAAAHKKNRKLKNLNSIV